MQCRLRQGCPLSPLLFNLVSRSFTILVNQFQEKGWLEGISIPGVDELIPILQYADDTILFFREAECILSKIQSYLTILSLILGPKINLHNSDVCGVGHDASLASHIASELGCQFGTLPLKYLGLPLGGRSFSCAE